MTLLPFREPTSGSHHGDLRAHSGQWAAPFKMLGEADGERVQYVCREAWNHALCLFDVSVRAGADDT